jgi:hypothetical protein
MATQNSDSSFLSSKFIVNQTGIQWNTEIETDSPDRKAKNEVLEKRFKFLVCIRMQYHSHQNRKIHSERYGIDI